MRGVLETRQGNPLFTRPTAGGAHKLQCIFKTRRSSRRRKKMRCPRPFSKNVPAVRRSYRRSPELRADHESAHASLYFAQPTGQGAIFRICSTRSLCGTGRWLEIMDVLRFQEWPATRSAKSYQETYRSSRICNQSDTELLTAAKLQSGDGFDFSPRAWLGVLARDHAHIEYGTAERCAVIIVARVRADLRLY